MTPKAMGAARRLTKHQAVEKWSEALLRPRAGLRAVQAIQPVLQEWLSRKPGLSYRVVQVLTGHGCFGEYLHDKAWREPSRRCHHCTEVRDTAQHTVEHCPAWADQRRALTNVIGGTLGFSAWSRPCWKAHLNGRRSPPFVRTSSRGRRRPKERERPTLMRPQCGARGSAYEGEGLPPRRREIEEIEEGAG
ncbi:uncharacterized protein LOC114943455 [Nylanderia fulva]|uniref:uncharacterized protein LOC114943455 n=1 Tax=Nylanderia fulva TaxID=613905 RepID=UPI0010FACED5|nr:uncharacterized protein LOC114943455 [Nylanderia fulva]